MPVYESGMATVIVPVDTAHVGCVTVAAAADGGFGTVIMVTVAAAAVIQVLSDVLLTLREYIPGFSPAKVTPPWYPEPTLYSTPDWAPNTMVPVGVPHVGCIVLATAGTDGASGAVPIVTVDAASVIQV